MIVRTHKYCFECAAVLLRETPACPVCRTAQPALPPLGPVCADPALPAVSHHDLGEGLARIAGAPAVRPPASHWDLSHVLMVIGLAMLGTIGWSSLRAPAPAVSPATSAPAPTSAAPVEPSATPATPATLATPAAAAADPEETTAWAEARRLVVEHLRAPPTAMFPSDPRITRTGPGTFEVDSYLETLNTHGVLVRTRWTAGVGRTAQGWKLLSLEAKN